jgi:quinol monooxygenase YgiN
MSKALFVALEANEGHELEVAEFLRGALAPVNQEPETRNWYALRFGLREFAIFDTFPGAAGQIRHLLGKVGRALIMKSFITLDGIPDIESADLLAAKPPSGRVLPTLGLHVLMKARAGQEKAVADFLASAMPMVEDEPGTEAWYALDMGGGHFAIVDFFAGMAGREAHLNGRVAGALLSRAGELLEQDPQTRPAEVLAAKVAAAPVVR